MKPLEGLGSQVTYPDAPEPGIHLLEFFIPRQDLQYIFSLFPPMGLNNPGLGRIFSDLRW